jgi:hypothetical protein
VKVKWRLYSGVYTRRALNVEKNTLNKYGRRQIPSTPKTHGFTHATPFSAASPDPLLNRLGEVVASDAGLFNLPVKVQFLPPVCGLKSLVVESYQEHRLAVINAALTSRHDETNVDCNQGVRFSGSSKQILFQSIRSE